MAETFGPFDGVSWTQAQWFDFAPSWAPSGVIGTRASSTTAGELALAVNGLNLTLGTGRAWVRGAGYKNDAGKAFAVTANANASLSRRDRIVLRRDLAAKTVTAIRLTGTPASTPAPPALTQVEAGQWDEPLFSFLVPPNSGTALTGFIDERRWVLPGGSAGPLHGFEVYRTGGTLPDDAVQNQGFAASDVQEDTAGYYSSGVNFAIIPAGLGGLYEVSVGLTLNGPSVGRMFADLYRNSGPGVRAAAYASDTAWASRVIRLTAGQVLALNAYQFSGGSNDKAITGLFVSAWLIGS